jgi:hypothetical protein
MDDVNLSTPEKKSPIQSLIDQKNIIKPRGAFGEPTPDREKRTAYQSNLQYRDGKLYDYMGELDMLLAQNTEMKEVFK